MKRKTIFGAEVFCEEGYKKYIGKKVGLLLNQASVVFDKESTLDCFLKKGITVKKVFTPQHGFFQDKQDNMKESEDMNYRGIEFISLYGKRFSPSIEDIQGIDTIFYDLQDVGARIYTFVSTLFLLIKTLEKTSIKLIILDRPNPLGRKIEENVQRSLKINSPCILMLNNEVLIWKS
jgi:uncharacterized protein YbbC (DUF1343 family)